MAWFPLLEPPSSKVSLGGGEHSQGQWLRRDFLNQAPFWDTSPGRDRRAQLPRVCLTITLWFLSPSILLLSALSLAGRGGHGKALFCCWPLNIGPFLSVLDLVEEFQLWIYCALHTKTYLTTKSCSGQIFRDVKPRVIISQNHFCCSWPLPYWSWGILFNRRMTKSSIQ